MSPDILTFSGRYFNFMTPETSEFDIYDIAQGLSNCCRFAGQTSTFYSVAQHSVLVSQLVPEQFALQGLLHDGAEAFIGDVTRPLKALLPDYKAIERRVESAIFHRFGLPSKLAPEVKKADIQMLGFEQRAFMNKGGEQWEVLQGADLSVAVELVPLLPAQARALFVDRYMEITGGLEFDPLVTDPSSKWPFKRLERGSL